MVENTQYIRKQVCFEQVCFETSTVYPILSQKSRAIGISTAAQFISATIRRPRPTPLARWATHRHSMQLSVSSSCGLLKSCCLGSPVWRKMQKIGKIWRIVPNVVLVIKKLSPLWHSLLRDSVSDMHSPYKRCSCHAIRMAHLLRMQPLPGAVGSLSCALCNSSSRQNYHAAECHVSPVKLKEFMSPSRCAGRLGCCRNMA